MWIKAKCVWIAAEILWEFFSALTYHLLVNETHLDSWIALCESPSIINANLKVTQLWLFHNDLMFPI